MSDLDDILDDGELESDELEDGGDLEDDEVSDDELAELGVDYVVSDQGVKALSGERQAALIQPKLLGSAVHLDDVPELEKKLSGESKIVRITIHFANGRKLHVTP